MMRKKNIVLNGRRAEGKELLREETLCGCFSEETLNKFMGGENRDRELPALDPAQVLYEDSQVLAVNKPAGMLSQKAAPGDLSLVEYVTGYLLKSGALKPEERQGFHPGIANRLDRNTSGLVLAGKTMGAAQALAELFRKRDMEKYYLCLVQGTLREKCRISGYLRKDEKRNQVTVTSFPGAGTFPLRRLTSLWDGPGTAHC